MSYRFLEHISDVKIQASGKTLENAFSSAALALKAAVLKQEKINIKKKIKKSINVEGKDGESLLYNFLEEFLYLLDAKDFILSDVKNIKISGDKLTATTIGDKASSYKISNEVKAVTYNEMFVKKEKGKYVVQFVLDV